MIKYSSNINVVIRAQLDKIQQIKDNPDPLLRAVALNVLPEFRKRVHVDGKDSSGGRIGTYSSGYLTARTGKFKRTSDSKVILSLTRQMENDLSVIASGNGYGIGYQNTENRKKADYCEKTYGKKILTKLTKEEVDLAITTAQEFTDEFLKTN